MVRIGKIVTFNGSRETINDKLLKGIIFLGLTGINWTFVNNNTINIYGEQVDLSALRDLVVAKGFEFTLGGNAPPEPIGEIEPPQTPDEIQAELELKQSAQFVLERDFINKFWDAVETVYNNNKTTAEPFRRFTDLKAFRQRFI